MAAVAAKLVTARWLLHADGRQLDPCGARLQRGDAPGRVVGGLQRLLLLHVQPA